MATPRYSKSTLFQRAINKVGKLNGLVQVIEDSDGKIQFKSSFDGKVFDDIPKVIGHIESTGINTFRVFGQNQIGSSKGLDQVASEASILSERLRSPSATQKQLLQNLGLDFLLNQDVNITYQKFNYEGRAQKLSQIVRSDFVKNAGIVNITDEGVTALNYSVGKKVLSAQQAKELKYVLGVGTLTENFVSKVLGDSGASDFSPFAKLPKRIQGMLSQRDVSLTGPMVEKLFGVDPTTGLMDMAKSEVYKFDDVSAFFRGMFGGTTTEAERYLLTSGLGLNERQIKAATMRSQGSASFRYRLERKFSEITGIEDFGTPKAAAEIDEIKKIFTGVGGDFGKFKEEVLSLAADDKSPQQQLMLKVKASFDGIERMRDGEFIGNVNIVDQFINDLQGQKRSLIGRVGKLSQQELETIREIDTQLESLKYMKDAGQEGLDSSIARLQFPGMQGKGEMFLRRFGFLPKELRDKMLILPQSAFKKEVQGIPSILLNVAKTHAENVYSDPLMLLYHQDYFGTPEFTKGVQGNIDKQLRNIQGFMESGALPEDVKKQIFGAVESQLKDDIPMAKLDAAAKASYLRNRAEAKTIQEMIQAGVDPRQIPALVRRVTDYYSTNAFRMKGARPDLVMPDVMRTALRTYESSAESGMGTSLYQGVNIKLSNLGIKEASEAVTKGIATDESALNFVQFRVEGNRMMLNGPNAHLYHHALGTFDLDDKGVPLMTTFKDANGNDRLSFMTMRQPTGFQEKIFMQGDLTHEGTLKAILKNSSGDFTSLLNDADAAASLSDPKEQRVLSLLREAVGENKSLDFKGLQSSDVEKVIAKMRIGFGEKHGFSELVKMTAADQFEMALSKSASPLGLDKVFRAAVSSSNSEKSYRDFLTEKGISSDQMPEYTKGNFVNLIADEQAKIDESKFVRTFNKIENTKFSNINEIQSYRDGALNPLERERIQVRIATAAQTYGESMQKAALSSVEDTLGLYINRQAAAVSMYQQVDDVLESLTSRGLTIGGQELSDIYRAQFSVSMIPPSAAVDVSKSLVSDMILDEKKMRDIARATDALRNTGVTTQAVENAIRQQTGKALKLGEVGQMAIKQTGKGVGFLRAAQIAENFAKDDLIGFDAALFGEGPYARIRQKDMIKTVESVLEGANEYLNSITDTNKRGLVQQFIDDLSRSNVESAIAKITLDASSRYSVVGRFAEQAFEAKDMLESASGYAKRMSRMGADPYEAFMQAKYMTQAEQIVESQRDNISNIMDLAKSSKTDVAADIRASVMSQEVGTEIFKSLSAIKEADSSANMLDAFDTLEATIRQDFDQVTANRILGSSIDIQGRDDALLQLREDARSRRISTRAMRSVDDDIYQQLSGTATREGFGGLGVKDITRAQAKDYISYVKDAQSAAMRMEGMTAEDFFSSRSSQELYDFMKLRSGMASINYAEDLSAEAVDAFRRSEAEGVLQDVEAKYNGSGRANYMLAPDDIGQEARDIVRQVDDADQVTSVARTTYRRFKDSLNNGAMKDVFEDKLIRRSTFAIAGLAAFGFIYSARKDRTQEEIAGPPLLPGGSAYEADYPKRLPSISDLKYLNPTVAGMQYKINVMGSQEQIEKMQTLASGVVDGPVDSTMYNSLPRLGQDPYSNVASKF